jgi:hypothetical protein
MTLQSIFTEAKGRVRPRQARFIETLHPARLDELAVSRLSLDPPV